MKAMLEAMMVAINTHMSRVRDELASLADSTTVATLAQR
jgi:hypothetical protein